MYLQLKKIVLWSRDPNRKPREVRFETGMVNVVMGGSRTGKSAVIPIMDYCLGSGSCAIPKKAIREACEWFGVVVDTNEGEKLFARKDPGTADSSDQMFVLEMPEIIVPEQIYKANTRVAQVKQKLDQLAAISRLDFAGGNVINGLDNRPSFRDLMAFVFQPQNVVANRDILFYGTDELIHRSKLARNILPYVLGAVSAEILSIQHEIEELERKLRHKLRELKDARAASSRWEAEMSGHLSRAAELGLVAPSEDNDLSSESMLELLRAISKKTVSDFHSNSSTISRAIEELISLETRESILAEDLALLKGRQGQLGRLREGAGGYKESLLLQRDRLAVSEWLIARNNQDSHGCPICGSELEADKEKVETLRLGIVELERTAEKVSEVPAAVDREVQQIRRGIDDISSKLEEIRAAKKRLSSNSEEAQKQQFLSLGVAHFLGGLGQAINVYDVAHDKGELAQEVTLLKKQINEKSRQVDKEAIAKRQNEALTLISHLISKFMPMLDNDHKQDEARLVVEDLTLRIKALEGESFLWSIGSGSNWLSYHLATLSALQCFFIGRKENPVPGLLVFDQPSQVYFPERVRRGKKAEEPVWNDDEDCFAVRQAFEMLGKITRDCDGKLQIIVLDHAPIEVWGHLENVTLAADWRSGEKLVPIDWPGSSES